MNTVPRFNYLFAGMALAAAIAVTGCSSSRETFGLGKSPPNEFAVLTRAPLSMPPNYALRAPAPGTARPQEQTVQEEARRILLKNSKGIQASGRGKRSRGETAILRRAGATAPDPNIRSKVARENNELDGKDAGLIDIILFWREARQMGTIVDAKKEARRLRENSALGDPPTKGRTPVIERKERGLLEGLLN